MIHPAFDLAQPYAATHAACRPMSGMRRARITTCILAVLLAAIWLTTPVQATEYRDWHDAIAVLTDDLADGAAPASIAADLRTLSSTTVTDGDGELQTDLSSVIALLERDPPDVDTAVAALDSLLAATANDDTAPNDAAARAALDEVLNRPEFIGDEPGPDDGNAVTRWIDGQFERLFDWLGNEESSSSSWTRTALTLLGIALVIGVIGLIIQAIRRTLSPKADTANRVDLPRNTSAHDARAEAERLAGTGDFRSALRWLYVSSLLRWQEAGRLRVEDSATNHEVLAEVQARGDSAGVRVLTPVIDHFERVWYGNAPCDAQDYRVFSDLTAQAWEHVGAAPAAPTTAPATTTGTAS